MIGELKEKAQDKDIRKAGSVKKEVKKATKQETCACLNTCEARVLLQLWGWNKGKITND